MATLSKACSVKYLLTFIGSWLITLRFCSVRGRWSLMIFVEWANHWFLHLFLFFFVVVPLQIKFKLYVPWLKKGHPYSSHLRCEKAGLFSLFPWWTPNIFIHYMHSSGAEWIFDSREWRPQKWLIWETATKWSEVRLWTYGQCVFQEIRQFDCHGLHHLTALLL